MKTKFSHRLFPRCTTSALTSKEASWASCVQSPGITSTSGFCQLRWRFFLVKLGLWSPYGTCSMLIKKTFGNMSIQQLSFRSTIFVPSPDKPRRYAQPRSPVEQVEIGTQEEQSLFSAHFLTKLRQELVEFMESQGYRWIGTAGF